MSERGGGRSGGIDNSGTMNSGGGDITGRDKIVGAPPAGPFPPVSLLELGQLSGFPDKPRCSVCKISQDM